MLLMDLLLLCYRSPFFSLSLLAANPNAYKPSQVQDFK
uniref:Uncharacterized protein n=1 Tax=Rhizophora mucronata TaxID=61149 RepID=A0A2P2NB78_RHIMU